uniref:PDZK1-interacting protein 1 n=1 Tax=Catharus ustulatus TaxID=91951 RepID=A0A8C3TUD3_CATUS
GKPSSLPSSMSPSLSPPSQTRGNLQPWAQGVIAVVVFLVLVAIAFVVNRFWCKDKVCSNVILTPSPKARGIEDQKAPHICSQFLCTGGVALGWSLLVPVHSCSLSRLRMWGAGVMISDDQQLSCSP